MKNPPCVDHTDSDVHGVKKWGLAPLFTKYEFKPEQNRRNVMKSSTKDSAKSKMHQIKGKVKEVAGKAVGNPDLELEGEVENQEGKVQGKVGGLKKVVGK